MATNIHDVAKLAGVSPRTVSNVVNNYVHVRPDTRQRVQDAIAKLNYQPNISARRLRQGNTKMLGFAVPELSQPYFAELSELVERSAQRRGYTVIATHTQGTKERELGTLKSFTSHLVDGLIFSPMSLTREDLYSAPPSVPTVLIGEQISTSSYTTIAIDNVGAAREITAHLIASGRRRIATVGAYRSDDYRSSRLRLQGFQEALSAAGHSLDPELLLYTDRFGTAAGYDAVGRALAAGIRFDALVCFADVIAFGAMRALADAGLRMPEDVAIVSIDDVQESTYSIPSLTSVAPDKQAIADRAVDTLVDAITSERVNPRSIEIGHRLVVRESSRARGEDTADQGSPASLPVPVA
ncbi:LacI family DNA-binding transcriptional regulator [Mycetocola zhujimingii]|uniref:LacI family DNA-binding transcriptional regulator n=1 Tax=Mycetocola zhujimingii TaxID=2079792 RepID=UPI000D343916|nr:LacI family DNA-binding transcriptional regulator [Mycetocola zhujimingii]AWB87471.1 LacI family transcriptional regulator [Mycetocola zhujimingii]